VVGQKSKHVLLRTKNRHVAHSIRVWLTRSRTRCRTQLQNRFGTWKRPNAELTAPRGLSWLPNSNPNSSTFPTRFRVIAGYTEPAEHDLSILISTIAGSRPATTSTCLSWSNFQRYKTQHGAMLAVLVSWICVPPCWIAPPSRPWHSLGFFRRPSSHFQEWDIIGRRLRRLNSRAMFQAGY
jgi:hypothetical protein